MKINKKTRAVSIETIGDARKIIAYISNFFPRDNERYLVVPKKLYKKLKKVAGKGDITIDKINNFINKIQ